VLKLKVTFYQSLMFDGNEEINFYPTNNINFKVLLIVVSLNMGKKPNLSLYSPYVTPKRVTSLRRPFLLTLGAKATQLLV